jgi:hypothetical protein
MSAISTRRPARVENGYHREDEQGHALMKGGVVPTILYKVKITFISKKRLKQATNIV